MRALRRMPDRRQRKALCRKAEKGAILYHEFVAFNGDILYDEPPALHIDILHSERDFAATEAEFLSLFENLMKEAGYVC